MTRMLRVTSSLGLVFATLVMASCGSKHPDKPEGNGDGEGPAPPANDGIPLNLTLHAGLYWEFSWTWETVTAAQGSAPQFGAGTGRYRATLGDPVTIGGVTAFPVVITGTTRDNHGDFAPRWTHLATSADGSLLGSMDGSSLRMIYSVAHKTWRGGGFLTTYAEDQDVSAANGAFSGDYNQFSAVTINRLQSAGGCTYYPEIGETICSGDPYTISEAEYFKPGIGPVAYQFSSVNTYSGGGFYSSHTNRRRVELVGTNLASDDGTVIHPPAWRSMSGLQTARRLHACAALNGRIYAIGGMGVDNQELSSVEIYDPATDTWSPGPSLPVPISGLVAEAAGGKIHVVTSNGVMYILDPVRGTWDVTMFIPPPFERLVSFDSCTLRDNYIMIVTPDVAFGGPLQVPFYAVDEGAWKWGTALNRTDHRFFAISNVGDDVYIVGGYMQYSTQKVYGGVLHYEPVAGAWDETGHVLREPRYNCSAVSLGGEVVVLGGETGVSVLRTAEAYNPVSKAARTFPPMLRPREQFDAVVLDGKIYAIGGEGGSGVVSDCEVYTAP